jgi:hypothetical protein
MSTTGIWAQPLRNAVPLTPAPIIWQIFGVLLVGAALGVASRRGLHAAVRPSGRVGPALLRLRATQTQTGLEL